MSNETIRKVSEELAGSKKDTFWEDWGRVILGQELDLITDPYVLDALNNPKPINQADHDLAMLAFWEIAGMQPAFIVAEDDDTPPLTEERAEKVRRLVNSSNAIGYTAHVRGQ